jgi:Cu-Zn family superoxide dismutase
MPLNRMPLNRGLTGLALTSLLLAGCGGAHENADGDPPPSPEPGAESASQPTAAELASVSAAFAPYAPDAAAVTYADTVPEGATVDVRVTTEDDDRGTEYELAVSGLEPDRDYGAHVHTRPCGENPDDSGPHYQDAPDPEQPSTDPRYANEENEVWLDFTTDAEGAAETDSDVDWVPREGEANSVVIHDHRTMTGHGEAGTAGDRLACVNVPL